MIFLSTTCFDFDILESPQRLLEHDITKIELSGGGSFIEDGRLLSILDSIVRDGGCSLRIHNYFPVPEESFIMNLATSDSVQMCQALRLMEKALGLCHHFGVPYYSFHPGYLAQSGSHNKCGHFDFQQDSFLDYRTAFGHFLKNFASLKDLADGVGVKLALENLFPRHGNIDSLNNTFDEFDELLCELPEDTGILIDLGHLNVAATAMGFDRSDYLCRMVESYGDRIFEIHISGNDGSDDQHLPIYEGDWQIETARSLGSLPGVDGEGLAITLESRKLPIAEVLRNKNVLERI